MKTRKDQVLNLLKILPREDRFADHMAAVLDIQSSQVRAILTQFVLQGKAIKQKGNYHKVYFTWLEDDKQLPKGKEEGATDSKGSKS